MIMKVNSIKAINAVIVLIIIAFILLVSCSGNNNNSTKTEEVSTSDSATDSTTAAAIDACSLITEEEVKAILGNTIQKGMGTATMCQYISGSEELNKAGESVSIQLYLGAADQFDAYLASAEKDLNAKPKSVSGVGDKAAFAAGQLIVASDRNFIVVIVGKNLPEEEQVAAEKIIAQKAIERMALK
jgi:hypothetical protein